MCPKCGSSYFRTDLSVTPMRRKCKGRYLEPPEAWLKGRYSGCDFTWPSTEDRLYIGGTQEGLQLYATALPEPAK